MEDKIKTVPPTSCKSPKAPPKQKEGLSVQLYLVLTRNHQQFDFYKRHLKEKFGHKNRFLYISDVRYIEGYDPRENKIIKCGEYWLGRFYENRAASTILKWFEDNKNVIEFKLK